MCWSSETDFVEGEMNTHPIRKNPKFGFVTVLDDKGKVVSNIGGRKPKYKKGKLQQMEQEKPIFRHCHDVCVDNDENLYVCQWNANKTYILLSWEEFKFVSSEIYKKVKSDKS